MTIRPQPLMRTLAAAVLSLVIGAPAAMADAPVTLTMYNGQHKEIGEAIAKAYEAKTGIHINIRKGSSNQLASQIIEEGERSPADIIYTEESPPLNNLGELGLLAKIDDATLNMLPKEYVAANGTWMGVTARTRVVVYNPKKIDEKDLPTTVMDFANPEWDGRVGFVPTSGAFQEQAVAILKMHGREATEEWLTGLKAFGKTYTNNMVALKAVEKGEVGAVLVNPTDEIMLITTGGVLVRTRVAEIREMGRRQPGDHFGCRGREGQQAPQGSPGIAQLDGQRRRPARDHPDHGRIPTAQGHGFRSRPEAVRRVAPAQDHAGRPRQCRRSP